MDTAKQAFEVFAEAERRMRELVGAAASTGDYELAVRVTEWAKALSELARSTRENPGNVLSVTTTDGRSPSASRSKWRTQPAKRLTRRQAKAGKKGDYPRFVRRDDSLVKIGWSKKEREEYEHKAPLRVAEALAHAIDGRSQNGRRFTSEDLFPLRDLQEDSEFPGYQGYVALAWFKAAGLVEQHGRSGYTAPHTESLGNAVRAAWSRLPERSV